MKLDDLKIEISELGVNPRAVDFESTFRDEVYCLELTSDGWVTYYRERGLRRDVKYFSLEDAACKYFYQLVSNDPTTFKQADKEGSLHASIFCVSDRSL